MTGLVAYDTTKCAARGAQGSWSVCDECGARDSDMCPVIAAEVRTERDRLEDENSRLNRGLRAAVELVKSLTEQW